MVLNKYLLNDYMSVIQFNVSSLGYILILRGHKNPKGTFRNSGDKEGIGKIF